MKKHMMVSALLALAFAATGCAAGSGQPAADLTVLQGKLVLKGSMPRPQVMLVRPGAESWELEGVTADTAASLQNQQVQAEGVVTRAIRTGVLPPCLKVTKLQPAGK